MTPTASTPTAVTPPTAVARGRNRPASTPAREETVRGARPPGLTRRTHPRSARAHRRALRRAFREAIRRALSRGGIALLAGALVAGNSQAQPTGNAAPHVPLYTTEGGSAYVLLKSDNVVDNYLAIHFDAAHHCRATLTVLDYYLDRHSPEELAGWKELNGQHFETGIRAQLDGDAKDETEAVIRFEFDNSSNKPVGLLSVSFAADTAFIHDLQAHDQAALRYQDAEGEWTGSIQYSLEGAHEGIGSAALHCEDRLATLGGPVRFML